MVGGTLEGTKPQLLWLEMFVDFEALLSCDLNSMAQMMLVPLHVQIGTFLFLSNLDHIQRLCLAV